MTRKGTIVGLVTPRYAPAIGGVERHVEALARGLAGRGIGVEVITTDPTGRLPPVEQRDGVLVRRFPTLGAGGVYFFSPCLGWWLLRNAPRFVVLHGHSYHTPVALQAAVASQWSGVPFLVTPHYHGTGHSPLRRALHLPYRVAGSWLIHQAQRVICVSEAERGLLARHFGSGVASVVVPNGVEIEELIAARPRDEAAGRVIVLGAGRLEPYKQTERLVEALPYLPPEYEVVLVGAGPAQAPVERLVQQLNVRARFRLLGQVSRAELLTWFRTATVFVSLSRHESFGLTVLEAAGAGAAVVASDIPAHREVAQYLPRGRVLFVRPDYSAPELARVVEEAARRGRSTSSADSPLPTWASAVDGVMSCYRAVLRDDVPGLPTEVHG